MPNDAKLGLVVGVGLVITIAVVFSRKEPLSAEGQTAVVRPVEAAGAPGMPASSQGAGKATRWTQAAPSRPATPARPVSEGEPAPVFP